MERSLTLLMHIWISHERKEVESKLEKSEAHLLRAQEVANAGSWDLDILSGKLFWSAEVYRIFGDASRRDH